MNKIELEIGTGEARTFEREGGVWVLTAHNVPHGIDYGGDLLGTAMDAMPAPKTQEAENV